MQANIRERVPSAGPKREPEGCSLQQKDCFVSNLPDLSQFLSISNSAEKLDDVTETMDSKESSSENGTQLEENKTSYFVWLGGKVLYPTEKH